LIASDTDVAPVSSPAGRFVTIGVWLAVLNLPRA
jgi:hypothetical protein